MGVSNDAEVDEGVVAAATAFIPSHFELGHPDQPHQPLTIEHAWTGIIGWSCDNLPWVGEMPRRPGVFVCAGFNGHGMTQTLSCGEAVAAMVVGEAPPPGTFVDRFTPDLTRSGEPWGVHV